MAKKKIKFTVSSQGKRESRQRRTNGIDGSINGGTQVQSNKGKKAYSRNKAKDPRNW